MISVCVAAFNGEKYIEEQILSVLRNLDSQDEIIISDDGSSDRTRSSGTKPLSAVDGI